MSATRGSHGRNCKEFSSAMPAISSNVDNLKVVALLCGASLLVSFLLLSSGLDLRFGFH